MYSGWIVAIRVTVYSRQQTHVAVKISETVQQTGCSSNKLEIKNFRYLWTEICQKAIWRKYSRNHEGQDLSSFAKATKIFYASAEVVTFNVSKKALLTVMSVREVVASCSIICSEQWMKWKRQETTLCSIWKNKTNVRLRLFKQWWSANSRRMLKSRRCRVLEYGLHCELNSNIA